MSRRRRRYSWRRARKPALALLIGILVLEIVYRLVALPPGESAQAFFGALPPAATLQTLTVRAVVPAPRRLAQGPQPGGLRLDRRLDPAPQRVAWVLAPAPAAGERPAASASAKLPAPGQAAPGQTAPGEGAGGTALVGIIIDDMGYNQVALRRLIDMPGPLTLSFLPDADSTPSILDQARRHDFEIMLHLPMEPMGDANPGREALMVGLDEAELRRRVRRAVDLVPGAVGVNNHMGSRFTAMARDLDIVMDELRRRWLFFIDSRTNPLSIAQSVALAHGIPAAGRNVFIDHDPSAAAIVRQLAIIERVARHGGNVLAIGHPYPTTLAALAAWLPTLEPRGFRLVRASEVVAARLCSEPGKPRGPDGERDCSPTVRLIGNDDAALVPQPLVDVVP